MKHILEINQLGKKFKIGKNRSPYLSLREQLSANIFNRDKTQDFWALEDVTFKVSPGESIGIIGRNGAGKSTLLKILSKITPPTKGSIISRGRIASLLEVGTGFHPELTGRENIFLNGSILGMKKNEIVSKFDEIVNFSEIENFIDTPLKHYSSGMQLRLAFSVAAFLEPEIMVIDEVLAVGDVQFQKKCMGKMSDVSKSGRTILFVSHNMTAVKSLCPRSLLLNKGRLEAIGKSHEIIETYLSKAKKELDATSGFLEFSPRENGLIHSIEILCDGERTNNVYMGCSLEIRVSFKSKNPLQYPLLGIIIKDVQNVSLIGVNNKNYIGNLTSKAIYNGTFSFKIPRLPLMSGMYSIDIHLGNGLEDLDVKKDLFSIYVEQKRLETASEIPNEDYNKFFIDNIEWDLQ